MSNKKTSKNTKKESFMSKYGIFFVIVGLLAIFLIVVLATKDSEGNNKSNEETLVTMSVSDWQNTIKEDKVHVTVMAQTTCSWCNQFKPIVQEVAEEEGDEVVEETVEEAVEEPADNETVVTEEVLESEEEEEVEKEPQVVLPERDFEIVKEVFVHRADKDMSDEKATSLVEVSTSVKSKSDKNGGKAIVNIDTLSANYKAGETVTLESLKQKHLVSKKTGYLKILGRGVLNKPLVVEADDFTVNALKMILLTGGRVIKID